MGSARKGGVAGFRSPSPLPSESEAGAHRGWDLLRRSIPSEVRSRLQEGGRRIRYLSTMPLPLAPHILCVRSCWNRTNVRPLPAPGKETRARRWPKAPTEAPFQTDFSREAPSLMGRPDRQSPPTTPRAPSGDDPVSEELQKEAGRQREGGRGTPGAEAAPAPDGDGPRHGSPGGGRSGEEAPDPRRGNRREPEIHEFWIVPVRGKRMD